MSPPSRSDGIARFFAGAFAITWVLQAPAALAAAGLVPGPPERYLGLAALGILGPAVAAMVVARRQDGRGAVRALLSQLAPRRASPGWYLLALLLPGAILAIGMALLAATGSELPWLYPPGPERTVPILLIAFGEEIGWRGFALPRLQRRVGPLPASVIIGILWALWHIPMFAAVGVPLRLAPAMLAFFVAGSVVFTWLYDRSGGSLLVAVLAHIGAHLNNSHLPLPGESTPAEVHAVGFVIVALLLVALDRAVWRGSRSVEGLSRSDKR